MEQERQLLAYRKKQDVDIGRMFCEYLMLLLMYNLGRRILGLGSNSGIFFLSVMLCVFIVRNITIISRIIKKRLKLILTWEICIILLYGMSYIRGGLEVNTLLVYLAYTGVLCIPMMAAGTMIHDKKTLYDMMKKYAFIMLLFSGLIVVAQWRSTKVYNMSFSYIMLLPLLIYINEFLREKKCKSFLFAMYILILILLFGSRGPVFCAVMFCVFRLYASKGNKILKGLFFFVSMMLIVFWEKIGNFISFIMGSLGIRSRSLKLLFNNVFYSSGRDEIWESTFELIRENWGWGCGIATDIKMLGQYPHNIFIELIYDFGIVFGGIIIVILICMLHATVRGKENDVGWVILAFGFFPLLLSHTYLREANFFFLMGICSAELKKLSCKKRNVCLEERR